MDETSVLSSAQSTDLTSEQLSKELDEHSSVAAEILKSQEEESIKKSLSNPSAAALSTTMHDSGEGVNRVKKTPRQLFNLFLVNQFVARGVTIRANTIISKGYSILGNDTNGVKQCEELVKNSGGTNFIKQLAMNTYIAGDGPTEKLYNQNKTKIVKMKQIHPLTIAYTKDTLTGKIIVDENGNPKSYTQWFTDINGTESTKEISIDLIKSLKFSTLGDEFTGTSLLQPGYDTIVRLMNMEYSAAEAAVKAANPLIVVHSNTKSPKQVAQWASILGNITGKDQIYLPEGMEIDLKSPGNQNFNDYAKYFLDAVVCTTGVPKSVLLGSSESSNRAESIVLTRHFYTDIQSDQQEIARFFNDIFIEYGELAGFEPPIMAFPDIAEDAEIMAQSAVKLFEVGLIDRDEARLMIGLENIKRGTNPQDVQVPPGSSSANTTQSISADVKKSDMDTWHPSTGAAAGTQDGEKKAMEVSPFSTYRKGKTSKKLK